MAAIAESKVLSAAGGKLAGLWKAVDRRDREDFGCRFTRRATRRVERGDYDEDALMAEGQRYAGKARDKESWLAFIKGLVEIFSQLAPLFLK